MIKYFFQPLNVIKLHKMSFFLWMAFTLFGGLIGIVISVIRYTLFGELSFSQALFLESINGSFYTYSIAIVASVLSGVFLIFAEIENLYFRNYQIPLITLSIFLMFFGGIFYTLAKQTGLSTFEKIPKPQNIVIDLKQALIFAFSVILSIYSFCVCRLDNDISKFSEITDKQMKNNNNDLLAPNDNETRNAQS